MSVATETIVEMMAEAMPEGAMTPELQETLSRVHTMLNIEDRGWTEMFSGTINDDDFPGPDLDLAQEVSDLSREMSLGAPLISRGCDLRHSYIWSKGIVIKGAPEDVQETGRRGPKSQKAKFFKNPRNVRYLLSAEAWKDMEDAAFNDGHFFFLGDDATKTGHPIPFSEISGILRDPDYDGEVLAYKRSYMTSDPTDPTKRKKRHVWYYTDNHDGPRSNPEPNKEDVEVDTSKTLFVKAFNTKIGWPVGLPDSLPGLKWARIYSEMFNDGRVVSKANAKFAYKVKSTNSSTAKATAAKISNAQGTGNTAVMGMDNELTAIPQANRSYDFNGLRPVASQVATSFNVSVVHLLSDPGAAGSSYGSASNLDLPTKRAMVSRQQEWKSFLERVLRWGTGEDLEVSFPTLDDPDPYREGQLITMLFQSGEIHHDEFRERAIEVGGFTPMHDKSPTGVMLPNNKETVKANQAQTVSAASPDQGKSNGTGGVSDSAAKDLQKESQNALFMDMLIDLQRQVEHFGLVLESRLPQ